VGVQEVEQLAAAGIGQGFEKQVGIGTLGHSRIRK
jgi:hypothetical protein